MSHNFRPIAFVLTSTDHGTLIVNRHDRHQAAEYGSYGVGNDILQRSSFDMSEVALGKELLSLRRRYFGDGVFVIDGGANIGVHSVEWARHMHGWGRVLSFEAQEVVFYALAGNLVINNCLNARACLAALGEQSGSLHVPQPDYLQEASFGSLELRQREQTENIGQSISYDPASCALVPMLSIDTLNLPRLDLLKLDVEGMEVEVLRGADATLRRCRPILQVEILKSDVTVIRAQLDAMDYVGFPAGINMLFVHRADPTLSHFRSTEQTLASAEPEHASRDSDAQR